MVAPSNESVEYDIILRAADAMQDLKALTIQADTFSQKIGMVSASMKKFSSETGISVRNVKSVFKEVDTIMSNVVGESAVFGKLGKEGWDEAARGAENFGHKSQSSFEKALTGMNAFRIALGAIVSMLLFQVVQAFASMAQGALKGLTEIEAAMFNIVNAEKKLSEQGVEVSVQGLQKLIEDLRELNPMLSEFQATELISTLTTKVAPSFGFGTNEIERMAKAVAVLAIRNQALGKSFEEVEQQFITGILSGKVTQGINQLGTKLTDQIVKEEAINLGLAKSADAYDKLNAKTQERINILTIISILEKETASEAENIPAFLQTASGLIGVAKAEFQDLLTTLGQKFAPVLKEILRGVIGFLEKINQSLVENEDAWNSLVAFFVIVAKAVGALAQAFLELQARIGQTGEKLFGFLGKLPLVKKMFPELDYADTPTGIGTGVGGEQAEATTQENIAKTINDGQKKIQDIMQDSANKKLDIERDYQRKLEDINQDYADKISDISRDTAEKREDALRNLNQKIQDINRDAQQKIEEALAEERQREIDREEEYQNKLRELREKFLFSLEDALHERDARQVLRLIRQYNMDKKNLEERHRLEREQAKEDLAARLADIEYERQKKLEAARREYAEKLEDIAIGEQRALAEARLWKQRALADARIWHQRQLQEQREYLQRKLKDLADAMREELNIASQGAQAITSLMSSMFANLASQFANGSLTPVIGSGGAIIGGTTGGSWDSFLGDWNTYGTGFAEGGSLIATRPTKATFGENGPERVDITPLGKVGNNVGKTFGDRSAMGVGGDVKIALELSPDLEARIVESSMDNIAITLERVSRTK